MLDQAGFLRGSDGVRFSLRYLTTPVREGNELALLTREALRTVGIRVEILPLESSLFFSRLQSGEFELFGSRILRRSANDPVGEHFVTSGKRNYTGYSNSILDALALRNPEAGWQEVAPLIAKDLPVIPLFTWRHGLLLSKRIRLESLNGALMDDSFRFLASLPLI
jgi:ABC-type transport system substrate-binding protein